MGGKAFSEQLPEDAFPRMQPADYQVLKAHYLAALIPLYRKVEVPAEAPEKPDHGDLDYLVVGPVDGLTHEAVKTALGATYSIPWEGNRTSHFAVPAKEVGRFYQIDVHVCGDEHEWEDILFFHGYGDLGMILGLLGRANGLAIGTKGMKIVSPTADETHPASFHLSSDFPVILAFFGLSMNRWKEGFITQREIFDWIASSRLWDPRHMSDPQKRERARRDRGMYQSFLVYAQECISAKRFDMARTPLNVEDIQAEALVYFGKKGEYVELVDTRKRRRDVKDKFNGKLVMEWTGLYGVPVRHVMEGVRARANDHQVAAMDVEELKVIVREEQRRLEAEGKLAIS